MHTPDLPKAPAVARVARSEAELLELATRIIAPSQRFLPMLRQRPKHALRIDSIGPTAMGLLQQILSRSVVAELLRRGGWQTRRTLVDGVPKRGRLWERHAELPPLRFGPASFELLSWLRAEDVFEPQRALEHDASAGVADDLLLYFAAAHVIEAGGKLRQPAFVRSPLCRLAYADALAGPEPLPDIDLRRLATGQGAFVLEALQPELARRMLTIERAKHELASVATMIHIGGAQTQTFAALFRALDGVAPRRRELAGFIAEAGRELLAVGPERRCPSSRWWVASLNLRATLAERQGAFVGAAAFLRALGQLGCWLDEAGLVAHFDEDYEAAQLLLSTWQFLRASPEPAAGPVAHDRPALPASVLERAQFIARELESLHSLGAAPSATSRS